MASAKSSSALALLSREDQNEVIVSKRAMASMAFRIQAMTIFLMSDIGITIRERNLRNDVIVLEFVVASNERLLSAVALRQSVNGATGGAVGKNLPLHR